MMRWPIPPETWCGKSLEHPERTFARILRRGSVMNSIGFRDLIANPHQRIERVSRILHDHGDPVTAYRSHPALVGSQDVDAVKRHRPGAQSRSLRDELQYRAPRKRLPGSGFADDPDLLASNRERHAANGLQCPVAMAKRYGEIVDRQKRSIIHGGDPAGREGRRPED
jgi:hypothetical protein